jgi:hypothetical protein
MRTRLLALCLASSLLGAGCFLTRKVGGGPKADPVQQELADIKSLKAQAQTMKGSSDPAQAAKAMVILALVTEAECALAQNADSCVGPVGGPYPPEFLASLSDIGAVFSEIKKQKVHLAPVAVEIRISGVSPLGDKLKKITEAALKPATGASQPGVIAGEIDLLKLHFSSVLPFIDVAKVKPRPDGTPALSALAVVMCDAILEILAAKNYADLTGLSKSSPKFKGFKGSIAKQKKVLAKVAKAKG